MEYQEGGTYLPKSTQLTNIKPYIIYIVFAPAGKSLLQDEMIRAARRNEPREQQPLGTINVCLRGVQNIFGSVQALGVVKGLEIYQQRLTNGC